MADGQTRHKIKNLRDILVGKIPDPKAQVEQITTALIYKFMDDMDQQSIALGGVATFFSGEFEKYAWPRIMDRALGGYERLKLYDEALASMGTNLNLPALFVTVFKDAFLPYRDPETLNLFLKGVDQFDYDHSERMGDAFEELLAIMGAQGDAGQFRTPRHIIDFIVKAVDPGKDDRILDPACGTAGFLISAYKHINHKHQGEHALSPQEKKRLAANIVGYDISPEMVRLSLVNMYLHQFADPHVIEYDTLTNDARWEDRFDVILANPPFMTPRGGIRPHNRFAVQANRAEVLFVDYIMEHLSPEGRAGIIVPEGIIFQSNNAYKQLRKMMVEDNYLYAVVSLPAGVFNPYAGVKTSILLLDRKLAKQSDNVLFVEAQHDGFDLGAQRNPIQKNDLPKILELVIDYRNDPNSIDKESHVLIVKKSKINKENNFSFSANRYVDLASYHGNWNSFSIGEIIDFEFGTRITKKNNSGTKYPVYGGGGNSFYTDEYNRENEYVIARFAISENCVRYVAEKFFLLDSGFTFSISEQYKDKANFHYIGKLLKGMQSQIYQCGRGHAQLNLDIDRFASLEIPLPPLDVQQEIAAEIEGYEKVIAGARQVIENYRPHIPVDPAWPFVELGEVFDRSRNHIDPQIKNGEVNYVGLENIESGTGNLNGEIEVEISQIKSSKNEFSKGDILYGRLRPNLNKVHLAKFNGICSTDIFVLEGKVSDLDSFFYATYLRSKVFNDNVLLGISGAQLPRVNWSFFSKIKIPFPHIDIQKIISEKLKKENTIINHNQELIGIFEKKIEDRIARVWGEEKKA